MIISVLERTSERARERERERKRGRERKEILLGAKRSFAWYTHYYYII